MAGGSQAAGLEASDAGQSMTLRNGEVSGALGDGVSLIGV
jgi:hypothetical protein